MADGGSNVMIREFEDTLSCPVCLELYENPQALSCQHVICQSCLRKITSVGPFRIVCPICRKQSAKIQPCVFVKQLVATLKDTQARAEREQLDCEICDLCDMKTATNYCAQCERILCNICLKSHAKTSSCSETSSNKIRELKQSMVNDFRIKLETVESCTKKVCDRQNVEVEDINRKSNSLETELHRTYLSEKKKMEQKYQETIAQLKKDCSNDRMKVYDTYKDDLTSLKTIKENLNAVLEVGGKTLKEYWTLQQEYEERMKGLVGKYPQTTEDRRRSRSPVEPGPSTRDRRQSRSPVKPGPSTRDRHQSHSPVKPGPSTTRDRRQSRSPVEPGPSTSSSQSKGRLQHRCSSSSESSSSPPLTRRRCRHSSSKSSSLSWPRRRRFSSSSSSSSESSFS